MRLSDIAKRMTPKEEQERRRAGRRSAVATGISGAAATLVWVPGPGTKRDEHAFSRREKYPWAGAPRYQSERYRQYPGEPRSAPGYYKTVNNPGGSGLIFPPGFTDKQKARATRLADLGARTGWDGERRAAEERLARMGVKRGAGEGREWVPPRFWRDYDPKKEYADSVQRSAKAQKYYMDDTNAWAERAHKYMTRRFGRRLGAAGLAGGAAFGALGAWTGKKEYDNQRRRRMERLARRRRAASTGSARVGKSMQDLSMRTQDLSKRASVDERRKKYERKWRKDVDTAFESFEGRYRDKVERAERDKRYRHVGNNVYGRNRRFFRGTGEAYLKQTARENKGRSGRAYVKVGYPNLLHGGLTYSSRHKGEDDIYSVGRPGMLNTGRNRAKARYFASHEAKHFHDYGGTGLSGRLANDAKRAAVRRHKGGRNAISEYLFPAQYANRSMAFGQEHTKRVARYEGRADKHASRVMRTSPKGISGYPAMALQDPVFREGYEAGGGKAGYLRSRDERKQWKKVKRANRRPRKD